MTSSQTKTVVVIGGGAAGFFAAITCKEKHPACRVMVLEKSAKLLSKVKISGGGRCNVTNAVSEPSELVKHYPRGSKELLGPFNRFNTAHTVNWFESRGVKLKTEDDNRIFPVTDDSQTIIDCLITSALKAGVEIFPLTGVNSLIPPGNDNDVWKIFCSQKTFDADKVIIASGSSESMWKLCAKLGHTITPPVPSLFTFNIKDERIKNLQGISVNNCSVNIINSKLKSEGWLLITHWGISGPAVLSLSSFGARILYDRNYKFDLIVNWLPDFNRDRLKYLLLRLKETSPHKTILAANIFGFPARLWERLLQAAEIQGETKLNQLSGPMISSLLNQLTNSIFNVNGKSTFKEEFVTCGGVKLSEVNFKTMESKIHKGLYFAGEVLDIDALTGGFNFQAAWTTGWIAGSGC